MEWDPEALKELEKVPEHVRSMAKIGIEMSVEKKTRIAVVRCDIVSEVCPGVACFNAFNKRKVHFEEYGKDAEII
jgi:hypothetical protein